jgi:serine/threonine protein kinase
LNLRKDPPNIRLVNLEAGTRLGDYRILSRIGRGSYGMVFEAEHVITRRVDAIKLLYDSGPSSADEEQRFLREIQVQASLRHPNIATVYTAFRTEYGLALAMELVPGETLGDILKRGRPPLAEGLRYMQETLSALSCAEAAGIVHRDIKPDNILVMPDGHVKITDFGLAYFRGCARITGSGENLGTPCYMSPEQVIGTEAVDARTDVYSTAVVLYEVVTGVPPFRGSNGFAVMLAHQSTRPTAPVELEPSITPQLNDAILKALEKDPANRFRNAEMFSEALIEADAPRVIPTAARAPWRLGRIPTTIAGAAACALGLAWIALGTLHKAPEPVRYESAAPVTQPPPAVVTPEAPAPVVRRPRVVASSKRSAPKVATEPLPEAAAPPEPPVDPEPEATPEKRPNIFKRAVNKVLRRHPSEK